MNSSIKLAMLFALLIMISQQVGNTTCSVANCIECPNPQQCESCSGALVPNFDEDRCISCNIANCKICQTDNSCVVCQDGFLIYSSALGTNGTTGNSTTKTSRCYTCSIQNCKSCSANQQCALCESGFTLIDGECQACQYPCSTCRSDGKCETCTTPFYSEYPTTAGECFESTVPQCIQYDLSNTTHCTACAIHYALNLQSNTCDKKCNYPCLQCTDSDCLLCQEGFFLNSSTKKCSDCGSGCDICTSVTTCITCSQGFYLFNNQCKICPSYCKSCQSQDFCTQLSESYTGYTLIIVGGKTQLASCESGCLKCSSTNIKKCKVCQDSFYNNDGKCTPCDKKCKTCSESNPGKCNSCFKYAFKKDNTCIQCNQNCLSCLSADAPEKCTKCKQGSYLEGTTCIKGCSSNCLNCKDKNTCTQCQNGYTLYQDTQNNQLICVQCVSTCRTCAKGQPANCIECGDGFYLSGSECIECNSNCKVCSSKGCSKCQTGYILTQSLTCAQACQDPCSTCLATSTTKCTSCIVGYNYNSQTSSCEPIVTCDGGCIYCPLGYALNSVGQCIKCTGTGCRSCNSELLNECTSCIKGYYINLGDNSCKTCSTGCAACLSADACIKCAAGYTNTATSLSGTAGFSCLKCQDRCATCTKTTERCTTCLDSYQLSGWKCISKFRFTFSLVLNVQMIFFYGKFLLFLRILIFSINQTSLSALAFRNIRRGSVIISGSADPSSTSGTSGSASQFNGILSLLSSGGSIADMPITSSSVGIVGGSIPSDSNSLGLILGICIPVGILVLAAIGLVIFKVNSKNKSYKNFGKDDKDDQKLESREGLGQEASFNL